MLNKLVKARLHGFCSLELTAGLIFFSFSFKKSRETKKQLWNLPLFPTSRTFSCIRPSDYSSSEIKILYNFETKDNWLYYVEHSIASLSMVSNMKHHHFSLSIIFSKTVLVVTRKIKVLTEIMRFWVLQLIVRATVSEI